MCKSDKGAGQHSVGKMKEKNQKRNKNGRKSFDSNVSIIMAEATSIVPSQ